ncbi:MAG TPA: hypothetical protein VIJ18_00815 [Microbacteriaceae bacterium]
MTENVRATGPIDRSRTSAPGKALPIRSRNAASAASAASADTAASAASADIAASAAPADSGSTAGSPISSRATADAVTGQLSRVMIIDAGNGTPGRISNDRANENTSALRACSTTVSS